MNSHEEIFTSIYETNRWGGGESVSGPGSGSIQTRHLRRELPLLLRDFNIQSVCDLPCGDFAWMKDVDLSGISYVGGDIVPKIIEQNNSLYKSPSRRFEVMDIISDPLPRADVILCRDCLVHFSFADIRLALSNICESGALFLITTTFTYRNVATNNDCATGRWRRLNLEMPPFNWPPPLRILTEGCTEKDATHTDKSVALWPIGQIRGWVTASSDAAAR
jgi:hypothetical protein